MFLFILQELEKLEKMMNKAQEEHWITLSPVQMNPTTQNRSPISQAQ